MTEEERSRIYGGQSPILDTQVCLPLPTITFDTKDSPKTPTGPSRVIVIVPLWLHQHWFVILLQLSSNHWPHFPSWANLVLNQGQILYHNILHLKLRTWLVDLS